MDTRPEIYKLNQLRSKTDRQLTQLILHRLDQGLRSAAQSPWNETDGLMAADQAYNEVCSWLPMVSDIPRSDRHKIETKLEQLRDILEDAVAPRVQTACS